MAHLRMRRDLGGPWLFQTAVSAASLYQTAERRSPGSAELRRENRDAPRASRSLHFGRLLDLLVGLDVPASLDRGVERAVLLLRLVAKLDLGEVQATLVGGHDVAVAATAGLERGDQHVGHLDHEELLLVLTGFAASELPALDVTAFGTGQHQLGRSFVDLHDEVEVLHGDLASAVAAACGAGAC